MDFSLRKLDNRIIHQFADIVYSASFMIEHNSSKFVFHNKLIILFLFQIYSSIHHSLFCKLHHNKTIFNHLLLIYANIFSRSSILSLLLYGHTKIVTNDLFNQNFFLYDISYGIFNSLLYEGKFTFFCSSIPLTKLSYSVSSFKLLNVYFRCFQKRNHHNLLACVYVGA